jgi:hypothetical protein
LPSGLQFLALFVKLADKIYGIAPIFIEYDADYAVGVCRLAQRGIIHAYSMDERARIFRRMALGSPGTIWNGLRHGV